MKPPLPFGGGLEYLGNVALHQQRDIQANFAQRAGQQAERRGHFDHSIALRVPGASVASGRSSFPGQGPCSRRSPGHPGPASVPQAPPELQRQSAPPGFAPGARDPRVIAFQPSQQASGQT